MHSRIPWLPEIVCDANGIALKRDLKELEEKYQLGFGITPDREADLYATVQSLLEMPDRKAVFQSRRQRMLGEKINFATFLTDFIEHYKA